MGVVLLLTSPSWCSCEILRSVRLLSLRNLCGGMGGIGSRALGVMAVQSVAPDQAARGVAQATGGRRHVLGPCRERRVSGVASDGVSAVPDCVCCNLDLDISVSRVSTVSLVSSVSLCLSLLYDGFASLSLCLYVDDRVLVCGVSGVCLCPSVFMLMIVSLCVSLSLCPLLSCLWCLTLLYDGFTVPFFSLSAPHPFHHPPSSAAPTATISVVSTTPGILFYYYAN